MAPGRIDSAASTRTAGVLAARLLLAPLVLMTLPGSAVAQAPASSTAAAQLPGAPPPSLEQLVRLLDEQRALVERQAARLDAQEQELAELRRRLDQIGQPPTVTPAAEPAVAALESEPPSASDQDTARRSPEMPAEAVSAGEFPGSIRIPGTEAAFRPGGQVRMTVVHTFGPLGVDDRFITSSIPVAGAQTAGQDARTTYTATPSRLNMDVRMPSRVGDFRTFLEWDFAADGNTGRLRHAFIHARRWLIGQTWSTFSDPEAEPIGIDFEGLNAISLFRQPQLRFTHPLRDNLNLALALENPAPDLSGAEGVNLTPDFVARLRWEPSRTLPGPHLLGRTAHVQAAVLVRTLRGELTNTAERTLTTGGFGSNVSGVLVPRWNNDDRIKFAVNQGWGIGRYITDLGTLGGQDAMYNPVTDNLDPLYVYSAYAGYERLWTPRFASAVTYGIVRVNNLDIQPADALRETQRGTVNVTWTPIPQLELVVEYLMGRRVNKDSSQGTSRQMQAGWTFRF